MKRRVFLKAGLTAGQIAIAAKAGLLWPAAVLATDWPANAFLATSFEDAVATLFAGEPVEESERVQLEAQGIAENGATVPIAVRTDLAGPLTVTLFSVNNPTPAVGRFEALAAAGWLLCHSHQDGEVGRCGRRGDRRRQALQRPTPYPGDGGRLRLSKSEAGNPKEVTTWLERNGHTRCGRG